MKHISEILKEYWERVGICMHDGKLSEESARIIAEDQIKKDYSKTIKELVDLSRS